MLSLPISQKQYLRHPTHSLDHVSHIGLMNLCFVEIKRFKYLLEITKQFKGSNKIAV